MRKCTFQCTFQRVPIEDRSFYLHMYAVPMIYLQFYTYASQDSLGLYQVSPTRKSLRPLQNFRYNFVSPGTCWDLKCESQSKNVSTGLGMCR